MIYGRRPYEHGKDTRPRTPHVRNWPFLHRRFQWKYSIFLLTAICGAVLAFAGPTSYFISQNYEIFKKLAYDTSPELLSHLEREVTWLNFFLLFAGSATVVFCLLISLRMTGHMIRPLVALEKHMRKVTAGDWSAPEFQSPPNEDFYELIEAYSYMYRTLRAHTESEIKILEKLSLDPANADSLNLWQALIKSKRHQLNLPNPKPISAEPALKTSAAQPTRRAS